MKTVLALILCLLTAALPAAAGCGPGVPATSADTVFQVSVLDALKEGVYQPDMTFGELSAHGDFGIGTLEGLDGEMIAFDGTFYQVCHAGRVRVIDPGEYTPFATVCFFDPGIHAELSGVADYNALAEDLDRLLPTANLIYAIRLDATFDYIRTRSVPAQEEPYLMLDEVLKDQSFFEADNIQGTLVGFRFPGYASGINQPGYHFHFLSNDQDYGGHVLECRIAGAEVRIKGYHHFQLNLADNQGFYRADI